MNDRPNIPYPVTLESLAEPAALASLRTLELGALVLLCQTAWTQSPPASLPDDDRLLARWAGLEADAWSEARPALLQVFEPGGDGRLHNARLRAQHDELAARAARRSAAGRKAATARHHGGPGGGGGAPPPLRLATPTHADRMRVASESHAGRSGADSPPTPPLSSERSAPMRSPSAADRSSAPAMGASESSASAVGAGARAQITGGIEALRRANDQRETESILRRAVFEFAPADRRTVPPKLAAELAASRHARPQLALYAVQQISDMCRKAHGEGRSCNPFGLLVSAFGAQRRKPTAPWEVPALFIEQVWERRAAERAAAADLQARIEALRARRPADGPAAGAR